MTNLFDKLYSASEATLKVMKKPFVKNRIIRSLDAANEKCDEIILEGEHKIRELLKSELEKSSDSKINLDGFREVLATKREAEQAKKDFAELRKIFFETEIKDEE